jgi:hypothetical protein
MKNPGAREQSPQGLVNADGRCSIAATSDGRDGSHVAGQRQARTGPVTRLQRLDSRPSLISRHLRRKEGAHLRGGPCEVPCFELE